MVLFAAILGGCAASLREPVTPAPPNTPAAVPWRFNRELLMPENHRILFLVEASTGHPPNRDALDDLVRLAARYGGRPASWRPHAPHAPVWLRPDTSYVFVKYVGERLPGFGRAYSRTVDGRTVYFILINQEAHRRWRGLLPERRLEQQTLVHEYGHLLGLPTSDHGYYPNYPDFEGGMHCVNPDCALARPKWRALLYNAFHVAFGREYLDDYCDECRAAIEAARRYWRELD